MTRTRHLILPAVLLAALAGCSSGDPKPTPAAAANSAPATRIVSGTLQLEGADSFAFDGSTCAGAGGYDDIRPGAQVVITDNASATIALGKLDNGVIDGTLPGRTADLCKFTFSISGVPTGKGYYGVEVSHRGRVQYPEKELFGALSLTLG
ncbi:hypothetical protein [Micromonospora sp. URMC 103]|uniref:hypothetical protein n=1 Tax=Micromonospora sp. URMC 103 TaxID=3423406 RepID=UPI003F1D65BD